MNEMPDENPIDEPRSADITVNPIEKNGKFNNSSSIYLIFSESCQWNRQGLFFEFECTRNSIFYETTSQLDSKVIVLNEKIRWKIKHSRALVCQNFDRKEDSKWRKESMIV